MASSISLATGFAVRTIACQTGARAGLVGTSGIRVGKAREASLDYIVANSGTITNAVSSRPWPGEAALDVSMVNWVNGFADGPHQLIIEDEVFLVARIPTHLQLHADVSGTRDLAANVTGAMVGITFATDEFTIPPTSDLLRNGDLKRRGVVKPLATGGGMLKGSLAVNPEYVVYLGACKTQPEAAQVGGPAYAYLDKHLRPHVLSVAGQYEGWDARWWQPWRPRPEFLSVASKLNRLIMCSKVLGRPVFAFLSSTFAPNDTMQVFAFDDDYSFGIVQSSLHWEWIKAKGGKVRADKRYTNEVWTTFPWPQEPTEAEVAAIATAARNLRRARDTLMKENSWSLRALYQAAEIPGPHPLKDAQAALDEAVQRAYGMPADQEATAFLLELNQLVAEDEAEGRKVQGPGVPKGLDARDPRWTSDDCIEPPGS